jgi:hypothetical protein
MEVKTLLVPKDAVTKCWPCKMTKYSNWNEYGAGGHEQLISNGGRFKPPFAERDKCKPILLGLSLARNLVKLLLSLYGTEWRERGYGLSKGLGWGRGGEEVFRIDTLCGELFYFCLYTDMVVRSTLYDYTYYTIFRLEFALVMWA